MKKRVLRIGLLLLCAVMLFASCQKAPALEVKNGVYSNPKTDVSYLRAPSCYEATAIVDGTVVARLEQGGDDILLYAIENVDTKKMIATANYELFYAEGETLPALWEMSANKVQITQTGTVSYALATVEKLEDVEALIEIYQNGASFSEDEIDVGLTPTRYDLKFSSSVYPSFYYNLIYRRYATDVLVYVEIEDVNNFERVYADVPVTTEEENGVYYAVYNFGTEILYNRDTGACWGIGDIVSKYLDNTAA